MREVFNNIKKKGKPPPYDKKLCEICPECAAEIVYRKNSIFGTTNYYKICNRCSWYQTVDQAQWKAVVSSASQHKSADLAAGAQVSPASPGVENRDEPEP